MVSLRDVITFILAMAFVIQLFSAGGEGSPLAEENGAACDYRCSQTHHMKPCLFFCNKCSATCLCVPSGT
ncbi:putative gibberellin regulated protein [Medicago truncatula]|uniref:GASA/GAST/Snakin n=1 Tax=Medicago truncatula TaxID=3880 RepID=G7JI91_MEDTR|nr:GASA/GAST/Snakin [Medicago truncatula]RHN59414.1 putative gibberellin regulated protein [Medicago truncatula]